MGSKKNIFTISVLVVFIALAIWFSYSNRLFGLYFKSKFTKEVWLNDPNSRLTMVDDLIESNLLIGKNKEEIISLIGDEFKRTDTTSTNWQKFNNWYYIVDIKEGHPDPTFNILDIEFSENKVIKVSQRK